VARTGDFYNKTVALYRRQFGALQAIILVMLVLSVASTVNMVVYERTGNSEPCLRWDCAAGDILAGAD